MHDRWRVTELTVSNAASVSHRKHDINLSICVIFRTMFTNPEVSHNWLNIVDTRMNSDGIYQLLQALQLNLLRLLAKPLGLTLV